MSEDEIRAFLMRWLMEFGPGKVTATERMHNAWYSAEDTYTVLSVATKYYFDTEIGLKGLRITQINQAGLDLIRGKP